MALLDQPRARCSGGRSTREARRVGSRLRAGTDSATPTSSGSQCPNVAIAALLLTGPEEGEFGSPESPQGAEFIWHGLPPARAESVARSGARNRLCALRGRQQHDSPRHFKRHLQTCIASPLPRAGDTEATDTCGADTSAATNKVASSKRQGSSILVRLSRLTCGDFQKFRTETAVDDLKKMIP